MRTLTMIAVLAIALSAQSVNQRYLAEATTTALTVQRPAAATNTLQFDKAWVYCAAAQTAVLSWNGTAATATVATITRLPGSVQLPQAVAYSGSNVGSGTTGPTYNVPAGGTFTIDLSVFSLGSTGANTNLTITTSGSCRISFTWSEK